MRITGQCHCGQIAYEAELDPTKVGICHCTDCQQLSASAFRTLAIATADNFRIIRGNPKEYIKVSDSGNRRAQAFCPECGSGLYATEADEPRSKYNLRAGTINERQDLKPQFEVFCGSAMPWLKRLEGTEQHDKMP